MRAKPRKFKKIYQIIALLIAICSLLGVSYAYWDDATTVLGKIDTGKIDMEINILREHQVCATEHGNWHECDNKNPIIEIKNKGSIPIKIDSIEIQNLNYYSSLYENKEAISSWSYGWYQECGYLICIWKKGWYPSEYINYIYKRPIDMLKSASIDQLITYPTTQKPQINVNNTKELMLNISYTNLVNQINTDMNWSSIYTNSLGHKHHINNIDVDRKGKLKVKINYSQWNTEKGWKKSVMIDIPTNWSRVDQDKEFRIYPNSTQPYAYDKIIPDAPKPSSRMIETESALESNNSSSTTSSVDEQIVKPSTTSESTESKVEAALEAMENANKQNESTASKEVVSDGSETTTSTTETSSSISEAANVSTETSNHTSEAAQLPSVGSTSESSEKAESSSGTSEATSANESN